MVAAVWAMSAGVREYTGMMPVISSSVVVCPAR